MYTRRLNLPPWRDCPVHASSLESFMVCLHLPIEMGSLRTVRDLEERSRTKVVVLTSKYLTLAWKTSGLGLCLKHAVLEPIPVSPLERCRPHNLMLRRREHVSLFQMHKLSALCTNCFPQATQVLCFAGTLTPSMVQSLQLQYVKLDLYSYRETYWIRTHHLLYLIICSTRSAFAQYSSICIC